MSLRTVQIIPEFLYDAPEQMADLFKRMWPVAWSYYPRGVHDALIETLHIATLGTILAIIMALPLGLLAANNITPNAWLNYFARLMLESSRSVNSLVWALLFVAIFGPGALAGTMAIDTAMNLFQCERVALMLVAIFAIVLVAEIAVTYIRKKII